MQHGASATAAAAADRLFGDAELVVQEVSVLELFPNFQFCSKSSILHLFAKKI
jgi:hypothetical protein